MNMPCRTVANEDLDIHISDSDDSLNMFVINLNVSLDELDLEIAPFVDAIAGNQVLLLVCLHGNSSFSCGSS
jgi:hypothetical protein